jgi:hypothetical protein
MQVALGPAACKSGRDGAHARAELRASFCGLTCIPSSPSVYRPRRAAGLRDAPRENIVGPHGEADAGGRKERTA